MEAEGERLSIAPYDWLLHEGNRWRKLATKEEIDQAIMLGLNYPTGSLALCDFIGLDTILSIATAMYQELRDTQYTPPVLLKRLVAAGHLGRKTNKGFYYYK